MFHNETKRGDTVDVKKFYELLYTLYAKEKELKIEYTIEKVSNRHINNK